MRDSPSFDDSTRGDGWERLAYLDSRFRDDFHNYNDQMPRFDPAELRKLHYPLASVSIEAAFQYVQVGHDFLAAGELGEASQAYWAALGLTSRVMDSKLNREQVRQRAYSGLAAVARQRQQPGYAALLQLCADITAAYTQSDQAEDDNDEFFAQRKRIDRALEDAAEARREASSAAAAAAFGAILQAGTIYTQHSLGGPTDVAGIVNVVQKGVELKIQSDRQDQAFQEAMHSVGGAAQSLRKVVAEDIPEIEAGKSFVGAEVVCSLGTALDPTPYFAVLDKFARDKPELTQAIDAYKAGRVNGSAFADLVKVADELGKIELEVARYERRGKTPRIEQSQAE